MFVPSSEARILQRLYCLSTTFLNFLLSIETQSPARLIHRRPTKLCALKRRLKHADFGLRNRFDLRTRQGSLEARAHYKYLELVIKLFEDYF